MAEGPRKRNGPVRMQSFLIFFRSGNVVTISGVCFRIRTAIRAFYSWYINWLMGHPTRAPGGRRSSAGTLSSDRYERKHSWHIAASILTRPNILIRPFGCIKLGRLKLRS